MGTELLEGQERQDMIRELIAVLDDKASTAEQMLEAQEKLDWFAREILDWFRPAGFRLLIYIPHLQVLLENKLYQPDKSRDQYEVAAIQGYVIAMGPDAYQDEKRFPNGPWCMEGDRVMFRAYSGTRFHRTDYPFLYALMNDDTVEAVMAGAVSVERPKY
jgi:co-chaperonin GroES (HSP10)